MFGAIRRIMRGQQQHAPQHEITRVSDTAVQDRFLVLLDAHRRIVHKVASSYARDGADREDLVQEMIAQLWRAFPSWDPSRRFSTWMYRIALNTGISWLRSESRRARRLEPGEPSLLEVAAPEPEEPDERMALLRELIARLPETDRALLLLYLDGHRHDAIAEIMGISESNVATRLHRLKQRLRAEV
jgi:RNA polymerase sigma-70 factor, ECF subfamily